MENNSYIELKNKYDTLLKSYIEKTSQLNNLQRNIIFKNENIKIIYKKEKKKDFEKDFSIINYYFCIFGNTKNNNSQKYIINNNLNINLVQSDLISINFDSGEQKIKKNDFENSLTIINNNFLIENKSQMSKEKEISESNSNININNIIIKENQKFYFNESKIERIKNFEISYISNEKKKIINYEIQNFEISYISNEKKKIINYKIKHFKMSYISKKKKFKKLDIEKKINFNYPIEENIITTKFDCIIEITRMSDLIKNGWKYYSNDEFNKYLKDGKKINRLVGIFGDKYTGKTFILNKILKKNLVLEEKDLNPSLSFKIYDDNLILLDSLGSNLTPNYNKDDLEKIDKNESEYEKNKRKNENELTTKINELFIRNFVLELSHLCLYVVPYLTNSEFERLNLIKKNFMEKEIKINYDEKVIKKNINDKVIIIHNIQSIKDLNDIANYEKILIRELNLEKHIIVNTDYHYYLETEIDENNNESNLLHIILGNDNFSKMKIYNKVIIDYLSKQISSRIYKNSLNLNEKIKEYFKNFALQYFDLKEKPSKVNEEVSAFVCLRDSIFLFKKNYLSINENRMIYNVGSNYNLRFKNITLDFISGQAKDKNVYVINQYRIYSLFDKLYIEFYPLGKVDFKQEIKPEIHYQDKYQKIIIKGNYESIENQEPEMKNITYNLLNDNIVKYTSFSFSCFISKSRFILTKFIKESLKEDGKLVFEFQLNIQINQSEETSFNDDDF